MRLATAVAAAAAVAAVSATAGSAGPAAATAVRGIYLALGDSVAFGYVPPQAVPPPNYLDSYSFVGYPEFLAVRLHDRLWNAACPGETTASMLSVTAQSNGCENAVGSPIGYRTAYPLHVRYGGSQMAYALTFLKAHKRTRLVTIDIGANDAFVCQETTADHCASAAELTGAVGRITTNLAAIFRKLRTTARYRGKIVLLTYYALDYSDPTQLVQTQLLDAALAGVAKTFGGIVADGFGAFRAASAGSGGDPCKAGLLIKLPNGTCNIHPSPLGQQTLAGAIAKAIGA